ATHTLSGNLRQENGRIIVNAFLTDSRTLVPLGAWRADYDRSEVKHMPVALAGMVTGALELTPVSTPTTVNAAATADFTAGIAFARYDPDLDRAIPLLEHAVAAD